MELTPETLAYLEQIIPGMKAFFLLRDDNLTIYPTSSTLPQGLGFSLAEVDSLVKKDALALVYPDDRSGAKKGFERCCKEKAEVTGYFRMAHKDGTFSWVLASNRYLGEMDGASVVLTVYNSALNQKDAYSEVLDGTRRKVYICDMASKEILYENHAAFADSGSDLLGKTCFASLYGKKRSCTDCHLRELKNPGDSVTYDYSDPKTKIFYRVMMHRAKWCDRDAFVLYVDDVSDLVEHQNEIQDMLAISKMQLEAVEAVNGLGDINSRINHALDGIRNFYGADRIYLFQMDEGGESMSNTHERCAKGVDPRFISCSIKICI
jgi:hypothetical protein